MLAMMVVIDVFLRRTIEENMAEKYDFVTQKMKIKMDLLFDESEEAMEQCLNMTMIQKSLNNETLNIEEKRTLGRKLSYIHLNKVKSYMYIDNKNNIYIKPYDTLQKNNVKADDFADILQDDYAKTKWFWGEDTLFEGGQSSLFIMRYMRSLNYSHSPGVMIFKMEDDFLGDIFDSSDNTANIYSTENDKDSDNTVNIYSAENDKDKVEEIIMGIADENGILCLSNKKDAKKEEQHQKLVQEIYDEMEKADSFYIKNISLQAGKVFGCRQENTGFIAFTYLPDKVISREIMRVFRVLFLIYIAIIGIVIFLSVYFARRFTRPIQEISTAMAKFDGVNFKKTEFTRTKTELDQIGDTYNQLLEKFEYQLNQIKEKEKQLRKSELNILIYQINPHFLYNTLNTIYMLARFKEIEKTMKMTQALSKYLRITLSNGNDIVSLEEELDNVEYYMEIQKIRNPNLFDYEVECEVDEEQVRVLKVILQPLVENAIKYGFCELSEGGFIKIEVKWQEQFLVFHVYNNGEKIEEKIAKKICDLNESDEEMIPMGEPIRRESSGYGVKNILGRLRLKYGRDAKILCAQTDEGTCFTIKIPRGGLDGKDKEK